jgi:hypothetical protein
MGKPETSITEVEVADELEKAKVLHIWEEDVEVPRWKATESRTYYCKVPT